MKTIQITIDESLLHNIDKTCGTRHRSFFFRQGAQLLLQQLKIQDLERRHQKGYKKHPVAKDEFFVAESDQVWPE